MLLRQPQHGPLHIKRSDPITKGLRIALVGTSGLNIADGIMLTKIGTVDQAITPHGVAHQPLVNSVAGWQYDQEISGAVSIHAIIARAGDTTTDDANKVQAVVSNNTSGQPTRWEFNIGNGFGPEADKNQPRFSTEAVGIGSIYYDGVLQSGNNPVAVALSNNVFYGITAVAASGANASGSGKTNLFTLQNAFSLNGYCPLILVWDRALNANEIGLIAANPWRVFVDYADAEVLKSSGGGGLSLTGSLTGQGSTLSASATNTEVHAISGTLVGAGATLSGTATRIYSLTGALTGQGATLSGSATTLESHAATGALVGSGSTLAATATNTEIHAATGALVGAGSALSATATNTEIHAATGALVGSGSTLSGSSTNTPVGINASGSLVGQGATLSATATNTEVHSCTGSLYGQSATLSGALTRVFSASGSLVGAGSTLSATASNAVALFLATGALVGQGSTLTGSATNTETHAVSGSLAGQGSTLSATAALANLHTLSGSLVGSGSSLVGYASGPTTVFSTSPDSIVTVINKRNRVSVISRRS